MEPVNLQVYGLHRWHCTRDMAKDASQDAQALVWASVQESVKAETEQVRMMLFFDTAPEAR